MSQRWLYFRGYSWTTQKQLCIRLLYNPTPTSIRHQVLYTQGFLRSLLLRSFLNITAQISKEISRYDLYTYIYFSPTKINFHFDEFHYKTTELAEPEPLATAYSLFFAAPGGDSGSLVYTTVDDIMIPWRIFPCFIPLSQHFYQPTSPRIARAPPWILFIFVHQPLSQPLFWRSASVIIIGHHHICSWVQVWGRSQSIESPQSHRRPRPCPLPQGGGDPPASWASRNPPRLRAWRCATCHRRPNVLT